MTYKTGSIGEFMTWTKRVVAKPDTVNETPSCWFDSDTTAAHMLGAAASPEALVKLLSEDNLSLLRMIASERPVSLRALALMTHRKESNLSRTLKKLHDAGIVDFKEGPGRTRAPRVTAQHVMDMVRY